jgi:hypothetical protein
MDHDLHTADRLDDGIPRTKVRGDHLDPDRECRRLTARTHDRADLVAREARSADDGPSDQSPRAEDCDLHGHGTTTPAEKDDAFDRRTCLRA